MMVFVWALPPVVNGSIWKFLLGDHGLINEILRATGIAPTGVGSSTTRPRALVGRAHQRLGGRARSTR